MRKYMNVIISSSIRDLVATSNARQIQKEDIVSIEKIDGDYVLIYYTDENPK